MCSGHGTGLRVGVGGGIFLLGSPIPGQGALVRLLGINPPGQLVAVLTWPQIHPEGCLPALTGSPRCYGPVRPAVLREDVRGRW